MARVSYQLFCSKLDVVGWVMALTSGCHLTIKRKNKLLTFRRTLFLTANYGRSLTGWVVIRDSEIKKSSR